MTGFGEMLARRANTVTLDRSRGDAWGLPIPRIDCSYSENEYRMAADMISEMKAMATAASFDIKTEKTVPGDPGLCVHEVGTARMGSSPRESVLDKWNRIWGTKNVLVVDGACYPSSGVQNPTLTMMALSLRACERAVREHRAGRL